MNRHEVLLQSPNLDCKYISLGISKNIATILLLATTILIHETTNRNAFAFDSDYKQDKVDNISEGNFNFNNQNEDESDISERNIINQNRETRARIDNQVLQNKQSKLDGERQQTIPDSQARLLNELSTYSRKRDLSNSLSKRLSEKASNQGVLTEANSSEYLVKDKFKQRQQELLNVLKQSKSKRTQILSQSDSSGVVGDTFADTEKLRQELLIDPIIVGSKTRLSVASPASTAGTPSAYGASSRQAYIGGGLRFPLDSDRDRTDGSLSLGIGEGDAVKSLGIEFNLNITSVGGGND
ncbi:MAG: hypothetical protein HC785_06480 [Calothrix sp. CSU_2_0]|nr:hypothetical protein [Calothrix sp. CSU_2_0]